MEIALLPQGNIRAKQQRLSDHRWVHVFDFAAGFYAVMIHPDSQPYVVFFVEGQGHFCYQKMPFGLTGAPSEFGHMTATRMHKLVASAIMELFVDDGGSAADTFNEGMQKLQAVFDCI
jgi:hypothetical protein